MTIHDATVSAHITNVESGAVNSVSTQTTIGWYELTWSEGAQDSLLFIVYTKGGYTRALVSAFQDTVHVELVGEIEPPSDLLPVTPVGR